MYIECKLKREGGSKIEIGTTQYHFAPQPDGAHVALVENEDHQDRFLGISEGYRVYRGTEKPAAAAVILAATTAVELGIGEHEEQSDEPAPAALTVSAQHDPIYTIHGKDHALADVTAQAAAANGLSADDWNSLSDEARADLTDAQLDVLAADTNGDGNVDASEGRAALVAQYQAKFGKKPHHKLSVDKIRAELALAQ